MRQLSATRLLALALGWQLAFTLLLALVAANAHANVYWLNQLSPSSYYSVGRAGNEPGEGFSSPYYRAIEEPSTYQPCGSMASDGRYLYWAEPRPSTGGYINRLDTSTEPPTLQRPWITSPEHQVCAVSLDSSHVYWGSGIAVSRADLDGGNIEPSWALTTTTPSEPWTASQIDCGTAVGADYIYWSDNTAGWIGRARLSDGYPEPSWINSSAGEQNPCGIAVTSSHIYWTAAATGQILSADLDGSNSNVLISGLAEPCGLTVHGSKLYWVNGGLAHSASATIGRANLDGSAVEPEVVGTSATIHKSCSIAVDDQAMPAPSSNPEPSEPPTPTSEGSQDSSQTPSVAVSGVGSAQGGDKGGNGAAGALLSTRACQPGWLRLHVRGAELHARVRLNRRQLHAGRVFMLARQRQQHRWLAIHGRVGHRKLSHGLWRVHAVYVPRNRTFSRCHSSRRVFIGKRHQAERKRLQLRARSKHCGSTPPFTAVAAQGVSCGQAKTVVRQWSHTRGCGPDGKTCHVQGWACVVPRRHNSSQLACRRQRARIHAVLGYY